MLYQINTTSCALALLVAMVLGRSAAAQGVSPAAPPPVRAIEAFDAIRTWVRSLEVPEGATAQPVGGACVTLRLRGRVVGRGLAIGRGQTTIPDAARLAIAEASANMSPVNDASAADRVALEARSLVIAVELSGDPVPIEEPTYAMISAGLSPGIDGVAVRLGNQTAAVFPHEMLATGQQAGSAVSRLVSELSGDAMVGLRQPAELAAQSGVGIFRLRTTAVAQIAPDARPHILHRGGRLVGLSDIAGTAQLKEFAGELASHLARHDRFGVYHPVNGTVGELASAESRALRLYALAAYHAAEPENAGKAIELDALVAQIDAEQSAGPVSEALLAMALHMLDRTAPDTVIGEPGDAGRVGQAIVAHALAMTGERDRAAAIVSSLRRVENAGQLVGVMPWLGWAEAELAEGADELPSAVALREMRRIITGFQLTAADTGAADTDLVGGIVFTSNAVPLPTWQTARPLAFLATMLRDPRLTSADETDAELVAVIQGLRFLRQLSASSTEGFLYRTPGEALGGVRAALWDHSMPIDATSMTLLAAVETLRSLDEIARREAPESP